ncbi:hypothetical protein MMC13_001413 [Lambiella insularis]|nr:hypothetical protein [Lambiella insularis]
MYFFTILLFLFVSLSLTSTSLYRSSDKISGRTLYSDAYYRGYEGAIARREAHNITKGITKGLKKAGYEIVKHKNGIAGAACTVGTFVPVVDTAVDAGCLAVTAVEAVKGAKVAHKKSQHKRDDIYVRAAFIQGLKDLDLL